MYMNLLLLLALVAGLCAAETDIITLDGSNFEKLTQAATGATTGDWMIKFYAPWCGHCKSMQPEYEKLATELKGEINVAEVDVAKDRAIGSRFDVKGFPTMLFLSGGKVFKYKGPRTSEALAAFARGGYKDAAVEADAVPGEMGYFGEVSKVFQQAFAAAKKDAQAGSYFTINTLTCVLPLLFAGFSVLLAFVPAEEEEAPRRRMPAKAPTAEDVAAAEPVADKKSD